MGLWHRPAHDLAKLEATGTTFAIMNGYLEGGLADDAGADMLLNSAYATAQVGKHLGVHRLNLHGTGLGDGGIPIWQSQVVSGAMWLKARDTLNRICDMAEPEGLVFMLGNLSLLDHPGCPVCSTDDVLVLVSSVKGFTFWPFAGADGNPNTKKRFLSQHHSGRVQCFETAQP